MSRGLHRLPLEKPVYEIEDRIADLETAPLGPQERDGIPRVLGRIEELKSLLSLVDSHPYSCGEVRDLTNNHLASVRAKIADLTRLERTLADVSARCEGGDVPECPIIDTLFGRGPGAR